MRLLPLPPYAPERNPVEHFWDELREKCFHNLVFDSLRALEEHLEFSLRQFEQERLRSSSFVCVHAGYVAGHARAMHAVGFVAAVGTNARAWVTRVSIDNNEALLLGWQQLLSLFRFCFDECFDSCFVRAGYVRHREPLAPHRRAPIRAITAAAL
ncbi:hypothetical protein DFQ30_009113 [Apophysomyces sp. BC1015]|nr:hypothetical protein DFQ30_009113 [Apophysomyces sp. BC1015]